ncbi:MAG: metallophosphoesterase [Patescibacteria group bacterium]|nr:metallophosphoesterase [Patescibacteria group bacterium]
MLYVTSDLHYRLDAQGDKATENLAQFVNNRSTRSDTLCIAGDIGSSDESIADCLALFAGFKGFKCAIAGNHDIWTEEGDSLEHWKRLPDIFLKRDFWPLEAAPRVLGNLGLAGTIGWYDYSFRDESLGVPIEAYRAKQCDRFPGIWNDALYVRWSHSDESFTALTLDKLHRQVVSLENSGASEIIVLMHHLPTKKLLLPSWLVPKAWRFNNAFLGSDCYATMLAQHPRVRCVVSGHSHLRRTAEVDGRLYAGIGGDYLYKDLLTWDGKRIKRSRFS